MLYKIAFYTKDLSAINNYKNLIDYKLDKGEWADVNIKRLFGLYISARAFDLAKQLKTTNFKVELPALPDIQELTSEPPKSVYVLIEEGKQLTEQAAEIPEKGGHVIIVSNAMCGYSQRFLYWLSERPSIYSVVSLSSTWLIPQSINLYLDSTLQRNAEFPEITLNYVKRESEWSEVSYWGTPSFYFYLDGKLIASMIGWPEEGRGQELTRHLKAINLLPN